MQKKLIALAVAGLVSGAAFADGSSVTIYGIVDGSFDVVKTSGASDQYVPVLGGVIVAPGTPGMVMTPVSGDRLNTGSYSRASSNSSYIGFKGSEDLGNNLKAVFQIESSVAIDSSALFGSARDTYAGLVGGFGAVTLGTLTTPTRALGVAMDVNAGATGIGDNKGIINVSGFDTRQNNTVLYTSNNYSGFNVAAAYVSGENRTVDFYSGTATQVKRSAWDLGLNYTNGPILVGLTYVIDKQDNLADTEGKNLRLAGSYTFGQGSVRALWNQYKTTANTTAFNAGYNDKLNVWGIGGTFNVAANGKLIAQYYKADVKKTNTTITGDKPNSDAKLFEIGYEHSLSKRTMIKAIYARLTNDSAAQFNFGNNGVTATGVTATGVTSSYAGTDLNGFQFGIRHAF